MGMLEVECLDEQGERARVVGHPERLVRVARSTAAGCVPRDDRERIRRDRRSGVATPDDPTAHHGGGPAGGPFPARSYPIMMPSTSTCAIPQPPSGGKIRRWIRSPISFSLPPRTCSWTRGRPRSWPFRPAAFGWRSRCTRRSPTKAPSSPSDLYVLDIEPGALPEQLTTGAWADVLAGVVTGRYAAGVPVRPHHAWASAAVHDAGRRW